LVVEPTPLKNDGVRQMGWSFPIYGKINQCSKPPIRIFKSGTIEYNFIRFTHKKLHTVIVHNCT
jgi:hypothetical protein